MPVSGGRRHALGRMESTRAEADTGVRGVGRPPRILDVLPVRGR